MTSVATIHICRYTVKAASPYVNELPGCVPKKFYLYTHEFPKDFAHGPVVC